jgi:hypothetical protein
MSNAARRVGQAKIKFSRESREDAWRRRQALQVAAQLPDDPTEALAVLRHAEMLVRSFLSEPERI